MLTIRAMTAVRATHSAISNRATTTTGVGLSKASGADAALNRRVSKGEVTSEDFEAVRQGLDTQTGEFPRQRHSADRIASNGAEQSKARFLYDMTFSAPKSVMAIVGGDDRLLAAHAIAVREVLEEEEKYSATNVAVRQQTTRLQYSSGKRELTSCRHLQQDRLSADERQTLREVLNEARTHSYSPQINRGMQEASLAYSREHIFE